MVLLDKIWDDVSGGPPPERGLGKLRKITTKAPPTLDFKEGAGSSRKYQRSLSMSATPGTPTTPGTPSTPSSATASKENVWRSVFHPGSILATKTINGAHVFHKPEQNSPTFYDWCYGGAWE